MKKFLLSFGLIVVFAFYALLSSTRSSTSQLATTSHPVTTDLSSTPASSTVTSNATLPISPPKKAAVAPVVYRGDDDEDYTPVTKTPVKTTSTATAVTTPTPVRTPAPAVTTPAPTPVVTTNTGKFKNGTFTGPVVDAYYGNIQVSIVTYGGKLTDVQFLQYPSDRSTSVRINTNAMPILKSEAISAQSAPVNGVSGASETSRAFNTSLASALALATN